MQLLIYQNFPLNCNKNIIIYKQIYQLKVRCTNNNTVFELLYTYKIYKEAPCNFCRGLWRTLGEIIVVFHELLEFSQTNSLVNLVPKNVQRNISSNLVGFSPVHLIDGNNLFQMPYETIFHIKGENFREGLPPFQLLINFSFQHSIIPIIRNRNNNTDEIVSFTHGIEN